MGSFIESTNDWSASTALQACLYCKQRKRKCDRVLPACTLCNEKHVMCDYSAANQTQPKDTGSANTGQEKLASAHFLDSAFWSQSGLQLPLASVPLSKDIMDFIGNPWHVSEQWLRETSPWLPILSSKHFANNVLLLLACMKVMAWAPSGDSDPRTPSYTAAKRSLLEAEITGVLSVSMLQAMIILNL